MKFITLVSALAAILPAVLASLTVNTPSSAVVCEPTQITWMSGSSPYYLSLLPGGQISATPLEQFGAQNGTSYTWTVNLAVGTSFTIGLKDSTGATAYSDIVTVQTGPSTSCINSTASATGSSSSSTTSVSSGSSDTTTGAIAGTTGTSSTSSIATSTASAGASSHTNAAGRLGMSSTLGVAGLMGLVGAALF